METLSQIDEQPHELRQRAWRCREIAQGYSIDCGQPLVELADEFETLARRLDASENLPGAESVEARP